MQMMPPVPPPPDSSSSGVACVAGVLEAFRGEVDASARFLTRFLSLSSLSPSPRACYYDCEGSGVTVRVFQVFGECVHHYYYYCSPSVHDGVGKRSTFVHTLVLPLPAGASFRIPCTVCRECVS